MKRKLIRILLPFILLFACLGVASCKAPNALEAPENLRIEDGMLLWDPVKYADGYYVYIDGDEYQTTKPCFDLSDLDEAEIYALEVRAYNKKGALSFYADFSYVGRYAVPTEGLEFQLFGSDENRYCQVRKLAVDQNGACVLPATHEGVPVTTFMTGSTPAEVLAQIKYLYFPHSISESMLAGFRMRDLPNLENVVLGGNTGKWIFDGNCLIERESNTLVLGCIGSAIPDCVTQIGRSAFEGRNVTDVTIPKSVTQIGTSAFSNCTKLTKVGISDGVGIIGDSAFSGCGSLKEVVLSNSVTSVGYRTFADCTRLEKIVLPDRLTSTRLHETFLGCTSLKEIKVPAGVTEFAHTFESCTSLQKVTLPDSVKSLTFTFANCTSLKSVTIPEGVTEMIGTFWLCSSLESAVIPGTVKCPQGVFYGCGALKSVTLDEGVTRLGWYLTLGAAYSLFGYCSSLSEVHLPSTLTGIDIETFQKCTSLKKIVLPENLKKIYYDAFLNCPLEEVFYLGTPEQWDKIDINERGNDTLLAAERYYYSPEKPQTSGNFWRFLDGVPTPWEE